MTLPAHPHADEILEDIVDLPNRWVRYPLARALLPLAMKTPITPNQITVLHALVGIGTGVLIARGSKAELILAFVLAELRMVLDCLDGVVARAKKLFSPNGRTIDEIGDTVGYISMQAGTFVHLRRYHPEAASVPILLIAILIPALMALGYDFYKRKFSAALTKGTDTIVDDLVKREVDYKKNGGGFVVAFGRVVDRLQLVFFAPRALAAVKARVLAETSGTTPPAALLDEVRGIRAAADRGELRRVLRCVGWMTGDNAVTMLNACLLLGLMAQAEYVVIAGGLSLLLLGSVACQLFLRRVSVQGASAPEEAS